MTKIALVQLQPELGDKEKNLEIVNKVIHSTDAPMIVFPEMFLTGYTLKDKTLKHAETIDGPSVNRISEMAQSEDRCIIIGMPEMDSELTGVIYNSALFAFPDGRVDTYRKMHLVNFGPFEEEYYFSKGNKLPIFDTPVGKVGPLICFDIFFPELSKYYAMKGAELLVCISASPTVTREFFEKVMVARAIENTVFFVYVNLVGTEVNLVFWGGNTVLDPRGVEITKGAYFEEGIVEADIDLKRLDVTRQFRPTIKETRGDILESLSNVSKLIIADEQ